MSRDTARRAARRSTFVLVIGAALATLLSVTSAGAVPVASPDGGAGVNSRTDVYIRDVPADIGTEPHWMDTIWESPDIKVCPTPAGCAVSQNPIVGITNFVFVTMHNAGPYGSGTGSGTLRLYRTTPGGGAIWPTAWTQIGAVDLTVPAGSMTVMIPWNGVPGPGHFCLIVRWESATDPFTPETMDINGNARFNNNIAWRNVSSVALTPGGPPAARPFAVGNPQPTPTRNSIVFRPDGTPFQNAGGRLVVDLGPTLFARWRAGGSAGTGITEIGGNQLEILGLPQARIDNLRLNPGERLPFSLSFSTTGTTPTTQPFVLRVIQLGPNASGAAVVDLGGVRYDISVGRRVG